MFTFLSNAKHMNDHSEQNRKNLPQIIWHRIFDKSKAPRRWWLPEKPIIFADDEHWQRQHDEVSSTIRRVMLAIVAYSLFCILALGSPDVNLIASNSNIKLPIVDTEVSYSGFLIAGPLILVGLFIYLQIFVGYLGRLETPSGRVPLPFVFNMPSLLTRLLSDGLLYWLVPVVLLVFTWKAAPRSEGIWLLFGTELIGTYIIILKIRLLACSTPPTKIQQAQRGTLWLLLVLLCGLISYTPKLPLYRPLSLFKADLTGLDLRGANLQEAFLQEADLGGANLKDANLRSADLKDANLRGANLRGANLERAFLGDANLERAFLAGANLRAVSMWSANLAAASLDGADLEKASLIGVNLEDAILVRANLRDAHLGDANLKGADLEYADLENAYLGMASLLGAKLTCEQLTKADSWEWSYRLENLSCGELIPEPPID